MLVSKLDPKVTLHRPSRITRLGYAKNKFEKFSPDKIKPPIPKVRFGNARFFSPDAEWGEMDIRNLFPCFQVDPEVIGLCDRRITHLGYAERIFDHLESSLSGPVIARGLY